jgi:hypothetical protein
MNISSKFKVSDFFDNGRIRLLDDICESLNINLSLVTYMRISGLCGPAAARTDWGQPDTGSSMLAFFTSFKKGSKPIRNVLYGAEKKKMCSLREQRQTRTFFGLINAPPPPNEFLSTLHDFWNSQFLTNRIKEFYFKFYNNLLGTNDRVAHFNADRNPGCWFCTNAGTVPVNNESFAHLFWHCQHTSALRERADECWFGTLRTINDVSKKKLFWFCSYTDQSQYANKLELLMVTVINYYIWETKLKKSRLSFAAMKRELNCIVGMALERSAKLRKMLKNCNMHIRREFGDSGQDGGRPGPEQGQAGGGEA